MTSELSICLLAHPDDEVFMLHHLSATHKSAFLRVLYLTDGGDLSDRRKNESLIYLASIGIRKEQIFFLGHDLGISDGTLMNELARAYFAIRENLAALRPTEIFVPAWEGGHHDHDALHLLGCALARHWALLDRAWQFPLYNGDGCWGLFFRVMTLIRGVASEREARWGWRQGLGRCRAVFAYPSQRMTWLGLGPFSIWHFLFVRREHLARVDLSRLTRRPHEGKLLYESYKRCTFEEFKMKTREFFAQYLA